jgi:hypothetical protein
MSKPIGFDRNRQLSPRCSRGVKPCVGFLFRCGIVTLSNGERKKPAALDISSGRDGVAPRVHRHGAEGAMSLGRGEVAFDVEYVVDGGMD